MSEERIRWAPMLRVDRLIRLYESDAAGMLDADLVEDVGWRLWERLSDVLRVNRGDVRCPSCGADFHVLDAGTSLDDHATCPGCGWTVTVADYHASKRKRDLHGNCPAYTAYVERFPKATTPKQRMMLIDGVLHELHLTATGDPSNFAAPQLHRGLAVEDRGPPRGAGQRPGQHGGRRGQSPLGGGARSLPPGALTSDQRWASSRGSPSSSWRSSGACWSSST